MSELLAGKVQTGLGDASHWLKLFDVPYSEKLGSGSTGTRLADAPVNLAAVVVG